MELNNQGAVTAQLHGAVPRSLAQSCQSEEYLASVRAADFNGGESILYDDCPGVVDSFDRPADTWIDERKAYAAVMKQILAHGNQDKLQAVIKVNAHVDIHSGMGVHEEYLAQGNHLADSYAGAAEAIHPKADPEIEAATQLSINKNETVIRVIASTLPLWSYATRLAKRREGTATARPRAPRVPQEQWHRWKRTGDRWQCSTCRARMTKPSPARLRQRCPGLLDRLAPDAETSLGHDLAEFDTTGGDFTICRQCGYWA